MVNSENSIYKRLANQHGISEVIRKINDRINGCGFNFKEDSDEACALFTIKLAQFFKV